MLSNYFTLLNVSRLIHQQSVGRRISEIYSQHKQQLCIAVDVPTVTTIIVSCVPSENYLSAREGNFRARKNSIDLFPDASGKKILDVACDHDDRIIFIVLEGGLRLMCEMFGSRANVLLLKEEKASSAASEIVIDAFLKKKELAGNRISLREAHGTPEYQRFMKDENTFVEALRTANGESIFQSLKRGVPVLGSTLAKEILFRANVAPSASLSLVTDRELKKVFSESSRIIEDAAAPTASGQARIYYEHEAPVCFSLIPLRSYEEHEYESFPTVTAAIQRFVGTVRASSAFIKEKEEISSWLEKEEKKAAQTQAKITIDLAEQDRRKEYELFGKLITAHLHELRKGMKTAALEDTVSFDSSSSKISVPLDPSLSPAGNAERYFEKAKKAKEAHLESLTRSRSLEERLSILRMLIAEVSEISSGESLKEFHQTYKTYLQRLGYATAKEKENLPPFRIFTVEGGFQVLAGKSSENNDMLTTKYAKPDDLWFHCRGSSGSHVVLKVHSAHGEPSKTAIHQAASIAAYYSKMKNASSVPVAMAEKKFVRKPKGAPAGTVILEREKVIFVEPKLPFAV